MSEYSVFRHFLQKDNFMQVDIKNIAKAFGKKHVLCGVSLTAEGGKCVGIIGANGCGKSTLFSILAGIQRGEGDFLLDGKSLMKNVRFRRERVGYIPQGTPLIDELTAYDNLLLWYSRADLNRMLKSDSVITRLGIDKFIKTVVRRMSGGMKKRLSIACAVAHNPDIIIMDEPTAALDIVCKQNVADYIDSCRKEGKLVLLATHEEQDLRLCDELYLMRDGLLEPFVYSGNPADIAEQIK